MPSSRDTIFALSSGRPPAAIAVIRISGARAGDALKALTGKIPEPRKAHLARLRDPQSGEIIDEALGLWFPGPNSETGEDTAELQLHGGRAVIAATLAALGHLDGLRPAEAGEFTRRAFENGKLDLTAVEGLADLVGAETEGQRRQAFRQMKGLLGNRAEDWRQRLIRALALVEARIDFSDEADVPEDLVSPALAIARDLAAEIEAALADGGCGERLRDGLVVAIAGPPNAGKSTLLNRIARREAAIVSPFAGTTRDVIEVHLDLGGLPVTLLDTAGIRDTDDPVEREGVRRARDRAAGADLVLWVEDASDLPGGPMAELAGPAAGSEGQHGDGNAGTGSASGPASGRVPLFSGEDRRYAAGALADSDRQPGTETAPAPSDPGIEDARLPPTRPASSAGGPARWLVRNKIDLVEGGLIDKEVALTDEEVALTDKTGRTHDIERATQPHRSVVELAGKPRLAQRSQNIARNQLVNKNELIHTITDNDEPLAPINKSLKYIANDELTSKSELKDRINASLNNMVNKGLTLKSESEISGVTVAFELSASSGQSCAPLLAALEGFAADFLAGAESALISRARHRRVLEETGSALRRALGPDLVGQEDLVAEELRTAVQALGRLSGRVDVEDVLDVIFRDFCIGK